MENDIYKSGLNKQLVLLLNKIGKITHFILNLKDLVPKDVTLAWLKYLRNEYPTIAFKASTQAQNNKLVI